MDPTTGQLYHYRIEIQRMDRPYSPSNLEYGDAYGALIAVVLV